MPFGKVANSGVQFLSFFSNMASDESGVYFIYGIKLKIWQETVSVLIRIVVIVRLKVCILLIGNVFLV